MDAFGDHLVSCSKNQPTQRHNAVRDALTQTLRNHGVACRTEVVIGSRRRPADVALDGFDARGPLAVDLVLHHPLAPSASRDPKAMKKSLADQERKKIEESEELCHSNGWLFAPMGWHLWGGVGPQAAAFLQRVHKAVAGDAQGWTRTLKLAYFRQRLSFSVMHFVGEQLLAAQGASNLHTLPTRSALQGLVPIAGSTFTPQETAGWERPSDPGYRMVGPIRVRDGAQEAPC